MRTRVFRWAKTGAALLGIALLTFFGVRVHDTHRGLPLEPWHTYVPHELRAEKLDAADWTQYLAAEATIFGDVQREVSQNLQPGDRVPANRYFDGSPVYPAHFAQDFNRSFVLEPEGKPVGAVVLLHGLTDSPYSQRHIARFYRDHGFVAIVPRLPAAHGTVLGRLGGGGAARGARSTQAHRAVRAVAFGRVLQWRRNGFDVCARFDRGTKNCRDRIVLC